MQWKNCNSFLNYQENQLQFPCFRSIFRIAFVNKMVELFIDTFKMVTMKLPKYKRIYFIVSCPKYIKAIKYHQENSITFHNVTVDQYKLQSITKDKLLHKVNYPFLNASENKSRKCFKTQEVLFEILTSKAVWLSGHFRSKQKIDSKRKRRRFLTDRSHVCVEWDFFQSLLVLVKALYNIKKLSAFCSKSISFILVIGFRKLW